MNVTIWLIKNITSALNAKKIATTNTKEAEPQSKQLEMTKTEKRLDNTLRKALTAACENIKNNCSGFAYLTHDVDLKKPAGSLKVTCYFIDELALSEANSKQQLPAFENEIKGQLSVINIKPQAIIFLADSL